MLSRFDRIHVPFGETFLVLPRRFQRVGIDVNESHSLAPVESPLRAVDETQAGGTG